MATGVLEFTVEFRNQRFASATTGLRAFADTIKKDWDGSATILKGELLSFINTMAEALSQRHGGAWPSGTTAQTLSLRSGALVESIVKSVKVEGAAYDDIIGFIGAGFPGIVHEFGATIKAKNKLLTIPLPAALDSRGIPLKKSARDWANTFVARSKKGNLLIFLKQGSKIIPLYVLKDQVTIPPRLGMGDTIKTGLPYFVDKAVDAMVKALIKA